MRIAAGVAVVRVGAISCHFLFHPPQPLSGIADAATGATTVPAIAQAITTPITPSPAAQCQKLDIPQRLCDTQRVMLIPAETCPQSPFESSQQGGSASSPLPPVGAADAVRSTATATATLTRARIDGGIVYECPICHRLNPVTRVNVRAPRHRCACGARWHLGIALFTGAAPKPVPQNGWMKTRAFRQVGVNTLDDASGVSIIADIHGTVKLACGCGALLRGKPEAGAVHCPCGARYGIGLRLWKPTHGAHAPTPSDWILGRHTTVLATTPKGPRNVRHTPALGGLTPAAQVPAPPTDADRGHTQRNAPVDAFGTWLHAHGVE